MAEKSFLGWFVQKEANAWDKCRRGEAAILPEDVVKKLPSHLQEEYRKLGYLGTSKITFFSTRRDAFRLGFSAGWALALGTDEGFKWAKLNYEQRRKEEAK